MTLPLYEDMGRRNADGEVRRMGGKALTDSCRRLRASGILADGNVTAVSTGCHGALAVSTGARRVIHAIRVPDAYSGLEENNAKAYGSLVYDCLTLAASGFCFDTEDRAEANGGATASVSIPALGCGVKGWNAAVAANCAVIGISEFVSDFARTRPTPEEHFIIKIVLWSDATARAWALVFQKRSKELTANANAPVDVDLSIDPECLGKSAKGPPG